METPLPSMPGKFGRPFRYFPATGQQRHFRSDFIDLSNSEVATAKIAALEASKGVTHIEITLGRDKTKVIKTLPLTAVPTPLALAGPDEMSPAVYNPAQPQYPQQQYAQQQQQQLPFTGIERLLYTQQEERIADARQQVRDLQDQVRISSEAKAQIQRELDQAKLDLQLRDRNHELDLRDARAEMADNAAPKGIAGALAGLPPEAAGPLVQGFMGLLGNFLGGGAAGAAGAAAPAQLGAGLSPVMQDVVKAATEIFPDDETAMRVMVSVSRLVKDPILLNQLYALGDAQAAPQPQYAG